MLIHRLKTQPIAIQPLLYIPILNTIIIIFMFYFFARDFVVPANIAVQLPKALTSDILPEKIATILVTGEDVIIFNNTIVTNAELKKVLKHDVPKGTSIFIKADGRASLNRITDVWNICRELQFGHVNIATTPIK